MPTQMQEARSLDLYADRPKTPNGIYSGPELPHAVPLGAPMKQPSGHPPAPQGRAFSPAPPVPGVSGWQSPFEEFVAAELEAIGRKLDSITESVSSMPHSADLTTQRSTAGEENTSNTFFTGRPQRASRGRRPSWVEVLSSLNTSAPGTRNHSMVHRNLSSEDSCKQGLPDRQASAGTVSHIDGDQASQFFGKKVRKTDRSQATDRSGQEPHNWTSFDNSMSESMPTSPASRRAPTSLTHGTLSEVQPDIMMAGTDKASWMRGFGAKGHPALPEVAPSRSKVSATDRGSVVHHHRRRGHFLLLDEVWNFLEYPESSRPAYIFNKVMTPFILMTVFVTLFQTVEPEPPLSGPSAAIIETVIDGLFFLEFLVRLAVSPNKLTFFQSFYNIIDLGAALPLFVRISAGFEIPRIDAEEQGFRYAFLVCAVPLLRQLKLLRRFEKLHLLVNAFSIAFEALPVLFFLIFLIVLTFAMAIFLADERENMPKMSKAIWFTIVTMTTVGYGDIVPGNTFCTVLTSMLIFVTMVYMSIPLGIIGSAFDATWKDRDRILLMQRTRERLAQWGYTAKDIPLLFRAQDSNGDGELNAEEFMEMLNEMRIGLSEDRIYELFQSFDDDGSGTIDHREFLKALFPKAYREIAAAFTSESSGIQEDNSRNQSKEDLEGKELKEWKDRERMDYMDGHSHATSNGDV
mmetsp:Transcript_46272/g.107624  ORF Transcript_46272/g.107624 Transcript_46272/m.107624 type:complete len:688 (+) Transcript_46272:14-2077(+)